MSSIIGYGMQLATPAGVPVYDDWDHEHMRQNGFILATARNEKTYGRKYFLLLAETTARAGGVTSMATTFNPTLSTDAEKKFYEYLQTTGLPVVSNHLAWWLVDYFETPTGLYDPTNPPGNLID